MSRPHRAADGCIIFTTGNRFVKIPWYLKVGQVKEFYSDNCPTGKHRIIHLERQLYFPFKGIVGKYIARDRGSSYIQIPTHNTLKYFPFVDVYCEEHNSWHFKGLRS